VSRQELPAFGSGEPAHVQEMKRHLREGGSLLFRPSRFGSSNASKGEAHVEFMAPQALRV
jgi:hypothetical protein